MVRSPKLKTRCNLNYSKYSSFACYFLNQVFLNLLLWFSCYRCIVCTKHLPFHLPHYDTLTIIVLPVCCYCFHRLHLPPFTEITGQEKKKDECDHMHSSSLQISPILSYKFSWSYSELHYFSFIMLYLVDLNSSTFNIVSLRFDTTHSPSMYLFIN